MGKEVIFIYDFFKKHRGVAWTLLISLTCLFVLSIVRLQYKEDISDFLPLDEDNQTALSVYQDISGSNKIYAIINARDTTTVEPEKLVEGVETFVGIIEEMDSSQYISNIVKEIDLARVLDIADKAYDRIPYYLTDNDYVRIDSLLSDQDYINHQLEEDKQLLLFPSSNLMSVNISRDPLNLFSPIIDRLSGGESPVAYESYDGYILSPDLKKAIVILESSFGAHESEHNGKLVDMLEKASDATEQIAKGLDIHVIGGPVIAVSNASQIKSDSILAVCIAGILILALLIYVFRNFRNILLIVVSVGWGWLFAMGVIGLFYSSISIIVIGIASVIIGIAVNYPLHLIDHLKDSEQPRSALKEIVGPLVVGNVTTVGAFLCLVPLNAPALHDLGLFASLLLVGTIAFVLFFLPQFVKTRRPESKKCPEPVLITKLAGVSLEKNKWAVVGIVVLTLIFGFFSLRTEFDSDMRNINYMSREQLTDLECFQELTSKSSGSENVYVVSNGQSWDTALIQNEIIDQTIDSLAMLGIVNRHNSVSDYLSSEGRQEVRLEKWNKFVIKYKNIFDDKLKSTAKAYGFSPDAFIPFYNIIDRKYEVEEFDRSDGLVSTVFHGNISSDETTGRKSIIQTLEVKPDQIDIVKGYLKGNNDFRGLVFDVKSMNGSIADTLSEDFNYIGFVCGLIVFVFLWISLGSIELAIVSFLPMAISWIWILGIMAILGIKFNIVNVILATFIFGQGDDYTIFMTEGLSYELAYRKKLLASYKNSIIVSALIMFIGIGTLIFAKHPALRSLGEVTVVGMLSVVIMAYMLPPLIFNWLVRKNGELRQRPITLKKILCTGFCAGVFMLQLCTGYLFGFILLILSKPNDKKRLLLHKYCCSVFRWDVKRMPGLKFKYVNNYGEKFLKPAVIISNHQSLLDSFYLMTLTPRMIMIANDHVGTNLITGRMFRWLGFITVGMGIDRMIEKVRPYVEQGYSVAIFPEGERPRNISNYVKRFHKGMIEFADDLKLDIVPIYLHGIVQSMPKGSAISNGGEVLLEVGKRMSLSEIQSLGDTAKEQAQAIRRIYQSHFAKLCRRQSTVALLKAAVYDRYRYKGGEIERTARRILNGITDSSKEIEDKFDGCNFMVVDEAGQGELALMLSLMYPEREIFLCLENNDAIKIIEGCFEGYVANVHLICSECVSEYFEAGMHLFAIVKEGKGYNISSLEAIPTVILIK